MSLIVQKFGGTSVANTERLKNVADIVTSTAKAGNQVVVVVSAQGDTTDDLIEKAAELNERPSRREMDVLLNTGEMISMSLLAMAIQKLGFPVVSLTGWQIGLETNSNYSDARIKRIAGERLKAELDNGRIVIGAGFQGINKMGDVTTLGRGGSDTTAVAIAATLGADLCHFNLHKAFSSPHGCMGPGCAAQCVSAELEKYLPRPRVRFDGKKYYTDYDGEYSIGKVRQFHGSLAAVLRAYAWIMSLGKDGLKTVAETAILNNNYMMKRMLTEVKGVSMSWAEEAPHRLEQVRYSFEKLYKDTGVSAEDVNRHLLDFGFQRFFASHHPLIVPEPFTPEPTESYSKADIDEYVDALVQISNEAYTTPEVVLNAPYAGPISKLENDHIKDWRELCVTWRAYKKQNGLA